MLLRNAGRVLTRGQLIDRIWGADYVGDTKTLDVHVKRLRAKIEPDPAQPALPGDGARSGLQVRRDRSAPDRHRVGGSTLSIPDPGWMGSRSGCRTRTRDRPDGDVAKSTRVRQFGRFTSIGEPRSMSGGRR